MPDEQSLFLSRVSMDRSAIVNPYDIHRLLWAAFPGMPEASRPYLYRVMPGAEGARREVLMQSTLRPTRPGDPRALLLDCREFAPAFSIGQRLRFEVKANPVKRTARSGDRVPLIRDEERLAWLGRQLRDAAEIENGRVVAAERLYFRKPGMRPGKIEAATLSGALRVKVPQRLLDICRTGVGPAKGFGCGLLLLGKT